MLKIWYIVINAKDTLLKQIKLLKKEKVGFGGQTSYKILINGQGHLLGTIEYRSFKSMLKAYLIFQKTKKTCEIHIFPLNFNH